jgi:putative tryptophan/tyrosine transport system substrate-binding protein
MMARPAHWLVFTGALALATMGWLNVAPLQADTVTLVAPSDSGIYREFTQGFQRRLASLCETRQDLEICRTDEPVTFATAGEGAAPRTNWNGELVIPLGTIAAEYVASRSDVGPTLFTLIPADTFQRLLDCCVDTDDRPVSAVFVDQPIDQQLRLTRALLPNALRVGVLLGPISAERADEIRHSAKRLGLEVRIENVINAETIGLVLRRMAPDIDALLAVPDPLVFNSATIANILLASYRHELPVIGYSEALVRSGATAALFADIDQLAETTALQVLAYCESRVLWPPGFALDFSVGLNREVLRSLGLRAHPRAHSRRPFPRKAGETGTDHAQAHPAGGAGAAGALHGGTRALLCLGPPAGAAAGLRAAG